MTGLAGFLALSFVVIATPGPDTVLTIRNTLAGGRRAGIATGLGVASGQAIWALATSAGLAALLAASRPAFEAIRIAGAVVLIVLGAQALIGAFRRGGSAAPPRAGTASARAAWTQGVISNLANPKMAVFFPSLLPQFVAPGAPPFTAPLALGLTFCAMTLAWLTVYAFVIARAGDVLRRSRIGRVLDALAGAVLIAFGARIATETR